MADRSLARVVWATCQPSPTSPSTLAAGIRTSSRNTSLKWASPVIWRSGRMSMPGVRHVDEEVGDALVLGRVGIGAGEQDAPLGAVRRRRSTPSGR